MLDQKLIDWLQRLNIADQARFIRFDGSFHRFSVKANKPNDRSGYLVGMEKSFSHGRKMICVTYGNWATGEKFTFVSGRDKLTPRERKEYTTIVTAQAESVLAADKKHHQEAVSEIERLLDSAVEDLPHPYLVSKSIKNHGCKIQGNLLLIPVRDIDGGIHGLQKITDKGEKKFHGGSKITGHFYAIGSILPTLKTIAICEGYATGASIHEAMEIPVACAFTCGNLLAVSKIIRKFAPDAEIIICGDDDSQTKGNPGKSKAQEAADAVNATVAMPQFQEGVAGTDFNDMAAASGIDAVRLLITQTLDLHRNRFELAVKRLSDFVESTKNQDQITDFDDDCTASIILLGKEKPEVAEAWRRKLGYRGVSKVILQKKISDYRSKHVPPSKVQEVNQDSPVGVNQDDESEASAILAELYLVSNGLYSVDGILLLRYYCGDFYLYQGYRYVKENSGTIDVNLSKWLLEEMDDDTKYAGKTLRSNVKADLEGLVGLNGLDLMGTWLTDGHQGKHFVVCRNGILQIDNLLQSNPAHLPSLIAHSPSFFETRAMDFDFVKDARPFQWLTFLNKVLPCLDKQALLQEWFGYHLLSDYRFHKFLVMLGSGANGKSVVCHVLRLFSGVGGYSTVPLEAMNLMRTFPLSQLNGKRANIVEEISPNPKQQVDIGLLKMLTSGAEISVEEKFKAPYTMRNSAKLTFATNELPSFVDASNGLWRRLMVLHFDVTIPSEDQRPELQTSAFWLDSGEMSGILNWSLHGLKRLIANGGFTVPNSSANIAHTTRSICSAEQMFLRDYLQESPDGFIPNGEIWKAYKKFCDKNGYDQVSARALNIEVQKMFPKAIQQRNATIVNGIRDRRWSGIDWQEQNVA